MRTYILILYFLSFTSCVYKRPNNTEYNIPANSKSIHLKLSDSLGAINCSIPNRYDTFFQWTKSNCLYNPCYIRVYRFQPKQIAIDFDTSFLLARKPIEIDSLEQFTIYHSFRQPISSTNDSSIVFLLHSDLKNSIIQTYNYKILSDTVQKINGRFFSIIATESYNPKTEKFIKKVFSSTSVNGTTLDFNYEIITKRKDSVINNFIENSIRLLKTIQINNGV